VWQSAMMVCTSGGYRTSRFCPTDRRAVGTAASPVTRTSFRMKTVMTTFSIRATTQEARHGTYPSCRSNGKMDGRSPPRRTSPNGDCGELRGPAHLRQIADRNTSYDLHDTLSRVDRAAIDGWIRGSDNPLLWGTNHLLRVTSGWKSVRERFPAPGHPGRADIYERQFLGVGRTSSGESFRGLTVGVTPSGAYLYPSFARGSPCFVPWPSVRRAAVRGSSIHVVVEYECPFDFTLPGEALPVLEAALGPEKIQRLPCVSTVLDGLARGPVQGYAPWRWLGWLVSLALKAVAKDAKEFERKHKL
jgi:hypothetical protein